MANSVGGLVVTLGLNAAEFTSGLTKAQVQAQRFSRTLSNDLTGAANLLRGALAGITVGALFTAFDRAVQSAAKFKQLSEEIGDTAEAIGGLQSAAATSGVAINDIASASVRLTAALSKTDDEGTQAGKAIKALGLDLKTFKALSPVAQIEEFSKALAKFEDGAGKSAVTVAAFGKQGAQLIPFFNDLADAGGRNVRLTQEQIEAADKFTKELALLKGEIALVAQRLAIDLIPVISDTIREMKEGILVAGGFLNAFRLFSTLDLGSDLPKKVAQIKKDIADLEKDRPKKGSLFEGFTNSRIDRFIDDRKKQIEFLDLQIAAQERAERALLPDRARGRRRLPTLNADFGGAKAAAALKERTSEADRYLESLQKQLEKTEDLTVVETALRAIQQGRLQGITPAIESQILAVAAQIEQARASEKELEATIGRERDILNARQDFLRDSYQDGRLSLEQFYDQLQAARDTNLQNTLDALNKEIALAEKSGFKNKANAARDRQTTLTEQARVAEQALARDRDRATEQYGFQLNELNAKMLELAGNTAKAAAIRFDDQQAVFNRSLDAAAKAGDPIALRARAQNAAIKEALVTQNALNDKNRQFQLILNDVGIAQERLNIAQQSGAIGEIEFLTKSSEVARSQITRLTAIADAMAKVAAQAKDLNEDGSLNIVKLEQLQQVEQLRLGIERLASQTDLLKDKFNNLFASSFADALSDLATGVKSFKDAVADMAKSITKSIADLAAQDIAQKLFGKEGPLSGIGGIFAKLFGGNGADAPGAASAAALSGSAATLTASGASLTASGAALDLSAVGLTTAGTTIDLSAVALTTAGTLHTTAATLHVTAATALTAAAGALTAAAAAMGVSSTAGAAGALFKAASAFQGPAFGTAANGTSFAAGGRMLVGERGPEELIVPRGAQVTPNHLLGKPGNVYHINTSVNVMPGATTASVRQAKAQLRDAVMQAVKER